MARRFENEARVVATGAQSFAERFGKAQRRGIEFDVAPPIAQWRCNLTGLSQVRNLYFVAYYDKIYVYLPHFFTQALPEQPALIVTSQRAVPGEALIPDRPGYLDPRHPHAVNNLVVQFLGTEEVVAVVRDNGDVDAFLVRHIAQAIDRRSEPGNCLSIDADEVRPFFHSNVEMSAWGLAIHSQARVIATSSNTHNITIFKFGLVALADNEKQLAEDESSSHDRGMDVRQQVLNGWANIPYIAFCNTGDDPNARWLLTTDVSGYCRSIDLHSMQTSQSFRFSRPPSYRGGEHAFDRHNSGWAIMFLDRRSFIPESTLEAALGLEHGQPLPNTKDGSSLWDISETASAVPDSCRRFVSSKRLRRSRSVSISVTDATASSDDDFLPDAEEHDEDSFTSVAAEDSDSSESSTLYLDMIHDDDGIDNPGSLEALSYGPMRMGDSKPRASLPQHNLCGDNPCPILHASVRSVYLLQPSDCREGHNPITSPTVGFTDALYQAIPLEDSWLNMLERLNMNAYIPAIGVLVLASQKGRALVISLTKMSRSAQYPATVSLDSEDIRSTYTMRIERIVPTEQQEQIGDRPFASLIGIATGPVQGTEHLPDDKKRWRLMMMYSSHMVLSYEITRSCSDYRDSAVNIHDVII